jgi:hypothetical protein
MKMMSSLMLNAVAFWGCSAWGRESTATETFRRGFELCVVSNDSGDQTVSRALDRSGTPFFVHLPSALSSSGLKKAKAVTKSSWYVLSGSHRTSTLLLKLKPAAVSEFHEAITQVVSRGDKVAILLNGEVIGILMFERQPAGDELAIDASFFSEGTENEKEIETRNLAQQINSTLY